MGDDFSDVEIGNRVFHIAYGWGTVGQISTDTFKVTFINGAEEWFWFDGKSNRTHYNPSVFWDEIKIVSPPKPKRKVEKTIEGWLNIYPDPMIDKTIVASVRYLYVSQEIANNVADIFRRLGEACHVTHKYTIGE